MRSNLQKISIILAILVCLPLSSLLVYAEEMDEQNKVYLVIANRLSFYDIESMHNLKSIIDNGSIGLMNTRGVTGYRGAEGYITVNTSAKAYSTYDTANSFNLDKDTLPIYERRVGKIQGKYNIANIELNRLKSLNINNAYNPIIGALGDNLHNSGQKTAVFGNSDTADSFVRTNCLIPIDSKGLIDFGNVDNILINDSSYPFGLRTDFNKILAEIKDVQSEAALFVIETGDLNRLNMYNNELSDNMFLELRGQILKNIDGFIGELFQEIKNKNSMLIIISPNSPEERLDTSLLSPLIIWGGKEYKGILTSDTTRRQGIVTNLDVAPTITNFLKAEKNNFIGHVIKAINEKDNFSFINELNNRTNITSKLRSPYLKLYSILIILIIILGTITVYTKGIHSNRMKMIIKFSLLLIMSLPLVFLLSAFIYIKDYFIYFIFTFILLMIIMAIICFINSKHRLLVLFSIIYSSLVIDLLLGGKLLKYSILSYDPIIGARYFGIGNEYAGVILGVMVLMTAIYMEKSKGCKIFLSILPITIFIVSNPKMGANLGGTISILATAVIYIVYLYKIRIDLKKIIIVGTIFILFFIILGLIDIYANDNPTHLGGTLLLIIEKGPKSLLDIITRKAQMNIKLMKSSIWSKVLLITILSESCILIRYKKKIQSIVRENKYFSAGLFSAILGSTIGLLLNDSGVLLGAISNTYIIGTLMYLLLDNIMAA